MKKNNKKKGFTIVELVIVIAVIAILAAVMVPTFSSVVTKANNSAALQEVKNAYTETLAADLTNGDAADTVYNKAVIVEHDGVLISITANGEASVVSTGSATLKVANGKLVEKTAG